MKKLLLFFFGVLLITSNKTINAQESDTLYPSANGWVSTMGGGLGMNAFIKFNISTIPSNAIVDSVKLQLYAIIKSIGWDGDIKFINVHNQNWDETSIQNSLWDSTRSDTISQPMLSFGTIVPNWASSSDIKQIFLRDFFNNHNNNTILLKDPDDGTMGPGMGDSIIFHSNDTLLCGNFLFNEHIIFAPRGYIDQTKKPRLLVNYTLLNATSTSICIGNTATISATGALSYNWSAGGTTSSITVNPTVTTTYIVTGTNGSGSTNTVSAVVTVYALPTISVNSPTITQGQSATLCASGGTTYTWSQGETGSCITITPSVTITYTVTGTNGNGCTNTANSVITVNPTSTNNLIENNGKPVIYPNPFNKEATLTTEKDLVNARFVVYDISGKEMIVKNNISGNNIKIEKGNLNSGIYFFRISDNSGCLVKGRFIIE
ncbi:MAG: T9SS type A sorting domain-containing protein [Bacteroidales bacterium]|nr:T9SS type A sorting domain-containing protein [Bacteroidales bacterium]